MLGSILTNKYGNDEGLTAHQFVQLKEKIVGTHVDSKDQRCIFWTMAYRLP